MAAANAVMPMDKKRRSAAMRRFRLLARSGVRSKLRILVLQCLLGVYPQAARQRNGGKEHLPYGSLPVSFVGVLGFAGSVCHGVGVSLYRYPAARRALLQLGGTHQGG